MWSPLFVEKKASALSITKVSPNAQGWIDEVIDKLLDMHPYLARYGLKGKLLSSDPERMYGWGYIEVVAKTADKERKIYVPFAIANQRLQPMRVFVDASGKGDLLTRDLVEKALYLPSLALGVGEPEGRGAPGLLSALYPPNRWEDGSVTMRPVGEEGLAAKLSSFLSEEEVLNIFAPIKKELTKEGKAHLKQAVAKIISFAGKNYGRQKVASVNKKLAAILVSRLGRGKYLVKKAELTPKALEVSGNITSAQDIKDLLGEDIIHRVDREGGVTITTTPAVRFRLDDLRIEPIEDYGVWKVQMVTGKDVVGWVITNVVDFKMNAIPLKIFTSGDKYAVQERIAGVRVSQGTSLPRKKPEPKDYGFFYHISPHGRVTAFLPVRILAILEDAGGKRKFKVEDYFGEKFNIFYEKGLKRSVQVSPNEIAIPDHLMFSPLYEEVKLVPDAALFKKTAMKKAWKALGGVEGEVGYNGDYYFDGPLFSFLDKKAEYNEEDAALVLAAVRMPDDLIKEALAKAVVGRSEKVYGVPPEMPLAPMRLVPEDEKQVSSLRKDTIKIAAEIEALATPRSLDAVLSLNFVNKENVGLFLQSLPHIEEARRDLADIYIATSLGLPDVSQQALITAMESLKEVADGLKKLKMRLQEE